MGIDHLSLGNCDLDTDIPVPRHVTDGGSSDLHLLTPHEATGVSPLPGLDLGSFRWGHTKAQALCHIDLTEFMLVGMAILDLFGLSTVGFSLLEDKITHHRNLYPMVTK